MFIPNLFKRKYKIPAYALLLLVFLTAGCKSKFETLKVTGSNDELYEKAVEYFNTGRDLVNNKKGGSYNYFHKAHDLYNLLLVPMRGTSKAEDVSYGLAYSTYYLGSDLMHARYLFSMLAKEYPTGKYAEEAYYMAARCLYEASPPTYSLDQSETEQAIEAVMLFMEVYPYSEKIDKCNEILNKMQTRLETKAFQNARQYLVIGEYKAASVALTNVLRDQPGTNYREEAEFLIIKSRYLYAKGSVHTKQYERYNAVLDAYRSFEEVFPDSKYMPQARAYYKVATAVVESINAKEAKDNGQIEKAAEKEILNADKKQKKEGKKELSIIDKEVSKEAKASKKADKKEAKQKEPAEEIPE